MGETQELKDLRWWLDKRPHKKVFANVETMRIQHEARVAELRAWLVLYLDRADDGVDWESLRLPNRNRRHRLNAVANGLRTVHAQVSTNKPSPWIVTSGGDFELQSRGKAMQKYAEGELDRLDA